MGKIFELIAGRLLGLVLIFAFIDSGNQILRSAGLMTLGIVVLVVALFLIAMFFKK
jgi:galactitol-specific phosphotransferase system IIC component